MNSVVQAWIFHALMTAAIFLASRSHTDCLVPSPNERLSNFCLLERSYNASVPLSFVKLLDYRLKREGFAKGLGLQGRVKQTSFHPYLSPI